MSNPPENFVVAVIATYNRPKELGRLLDCLKKIPTGLGAVLVVDNADDPSTAAAVKTFACAQRIVPGKNLGCGGGLHLAETAALERFGQQLTHLWILDDDVVLSPDLLQLLTGRMAEENADLVCPMVTNAEGRLGWFPGLLDASKFQFIKHCKTPAEFIVRQSSAAIPFSWAQGISLLVSRRAFLEKGTHRTDFWVRGEDLEFSLRLTHTYRGVFLPEVSVQHLPPAVAGAEERDKHAAMLQNICFISLRLPHGRRIARTIPGNFLRFLRTWGPLSLPQALGSFFKGALLGKPAGAA